MWWNKPNPDKATRLEAKGDRLLAREKLKGALKKYKKALDYDPSRKGIYDKLMETRDKLPGDWEMSDFVESVDWAMKKQEQENPPIRQLHAKLSPDWDKAHELAFKLMSTASEENTRTMTEELVAMGEIGTRAAIDILLELKAGAEKMQNEDIVEEEK